MATSNSNTNSVRALGGLLAGLVLLCLASCATSDPVTPDGTGGNTTGSGGTTPGSGGTTPGSGGTTAGSGGMTAGTGGAPGTGGSMTGTGGIGAAGQTGSGGSGTGGRVGGTGGMTGTGGRVGGTGGTTGTGGSGAGGASGPCPSGTTAEFGCGPARTMGYMGCSMSVNVASGYGRQMGMRMWPAISSYGGQVVQSWTAASSAGWTGFNGAVTQYGVPTDIWMMICIFTNNGVTAAEVQTMIRNARMRAPNAKIWVTGQPTYNQGHTCSLAGASGPGLTDMRAREANNPANNVFYAGTFVLNASVNPSEVAGDTCHASSQGELALGNQLIAKFGK